MEKNARVEEGKTPSVVSGKPCTRIKDGEPLCDGEKCRDIKKVKVDPKVAK